MASPAHRGSGPAVPLFRYAHRSRAGSSRLLASRRSAGSLIDASLGAVDSITMGSRSGLGRGSRKGERLTSALHVFRTWTVGRTDHTDRVAAFDSHGNFHG